MGVLANLWRLARTGATFQRTGAMDEVLEALEAPPALRAAARILGWPLAPLGLAGDPALPPLPRALTALGPAYVKFGQTLSTRPDVVGARLAAELSVLQDRLAPFPEAEARAEIARELGAPADELFADFGPAVAAASIAQVHPAVDRATGRKVAVKVLRPGVERAFRKDVDAFFFIAEVIELMLPASRRLRPRAVCRHFAQVVATELDLRLEASAAAEFRANSRDDPGFAVPEVVWNLSARRVLTLEWVDGLPMSDVPAIAAAGVDLRDLSRRVIQTFLRHALRDGFFHGDMHQGNLKVAPDGTLIALDFGIMGRIDPYTRRVYAEILYGFLQQDYRRVAEVHFEAGYVPEGQDLETFAQALRSIGEPIFGQDASRISMARLLSHLFEVTERFGMQTRTELILLQRTMVVVEGVARTLDPQVNMWRTAQPVVEEFMHANLGPAAALRDLRRTATVLARFGPRLPDVVERALRRAAVAGPEPDDAPARLGPALAGALAGAAAAAAVALLL
ncbi:2-polyprenylphenol 6-hydroxylase [Oceanicella actignis]|uniref:2-octaprenylphenol hydroxylase n=1 Tax=Oceanicella actignis TaxID=1189325 RepID=A0A1M7SU49_9RHOB|nr:2-polyprenylphenol 6-hydroxylase [Oceanicella actignis]SES70535.1 2-octaprenylphenol hydroxylase [Oceanicella actignis]SHN61914.1 2-octaprenylphenol hydroxylase [Oceanicella actignis]